MNKQLIRDYIRALKNLYGIVSTDKLVEIYNLQNKDKITTDHVSDSVDDDFLEKAFVYCVLDTFIDANLDIGKIEYMLSNHTNKPYYIPEKSKLLKYRNDDYFEKTLHYKNFLTFVRNNIEKDPTLARELCEDVVLAITMERGSFDGVFFEFERRQKGFKSEEELKEMIDLAIKLANNTRLQENRGYTPEELFRLPQNFKNH